MLPESTNFSRHISWRVGMKKISFLIILPLLGLSLISSHLFATTRGIRVTSKEGQSLFLYKDYYALVVGISNYERWPKLPNAVNDATEVAAKLKELGFKVRLSLDPTSREMKTLLNEMVYKMGREENRALLFYYAGHGETEALADKTKMGYIIPRDCPLLEKSPMGFATHAISMRDIESVSMRIRSKHVVMVFDSCFSGSLFALVRAVPHDITEKSTLPVRQYITAGREDEQVPDKSMFKRCFLVGLEGDADLTGDGYITGSELGMYLSDKVVNYTHRRQHPQYGKINNPDLDRGDFIFALETPSKPSSPVSKVLPPSLNAEKKRLAEERASLERERRELEELKTLREEEKKLEDERRHLAAEKKRLASIPKAVKDAQVYKVKLRDIPKELSGSHVKNIINKHHFFVKDLNEKGDFPNNFVDNGDETVTDRATGLMWEKGGSSSLLRYWKAEKYVSRLNREKFLGYNDWRIPTLEELCSLLEREKNERGQHISPLFKDKQSKCLSADRFWGTDSSAFCGVYNIVNFTKGKIDEIATEHLGQDVCYSIYFFIKAVRSIK
jgi:hypothetical protein